LINYALVRSGMEGFAFFDFAAFGISILILGILYMLVARRWLTQQDREGGTSPRPRSRWP
jgi:di/tricarboxylate transporter